MSKNEIQPKSLEKSLALVTLLIALILSLDKAIDDEADILNCIVAAPKVEALMERVEQLLVP